MIPGCSRNWRRTSSTTSPPTRPTACIASDANRNGIRPPMKRPAITHASERSRTSSASAAGRCEARRVRVEQDERGERGGADRVALRDGLRRVADRVERVGDRRARSSGRSAISAMPPALSVTGPYASSATIRPVIESCAITATPMPKRPAKWCATRMPAAITITGSGRRLHADGEPFDDVRRVAGLRRLRDRLDRVPARAGVVLGDRDEQERDDQADERRDVEVA